LKFQILGPLEVRSGERPLVVPRAKQRTLLLALLLNANEVISSDRLIEAVWGEQPPATATTALHGHVSQLRKLLPPDTLLTQAPGYLLRVEPGELDVHRFEDLRAHARAAVDDGRPAEAVALLREALGLWHGAPLADATYEPFAAAEIARLEELRSETIEERIHAELSAGLDAELIGELEGLVRAEPFRERRRAQLMLALYRAGRQADALQIYQEGRRRLDEELGLAPGPELQELQQRILAQDPTLRGAARRMDVVAVPRESRRTVTILAIGIEPGSGDPEALRNASGRALTAIDGSLTRHGGVIERELGDVYVCVFGAEDVQEEAPIRALRVAAELRDALHLRLGVATGEVVVSEGGVIGAAIAQAQRLQLVAAVDEILIDRPTWRLVRDAVVAEPTGAAFRVLDVDLWRPGVARRLDSPLVGRAHELQLVLSAFERALSTRTPQLLALVGPAGVGKSRLATELAVHAEGRATILHGRCLSYGEGITFWPVRELVREAVGAAQKDPAEAVAAALEELLGVGNDSAQLAGILGVGEPVASGAELFHAVRALLELLAQRQPLVIVLDDLEHAEPVLLDLIEYVVELSRDVPLLVVCLSRPDLLEQRPGWAGVRSNATAISLDPLNAAESERLIENLLGGEPLPTAVAERFAAAAGGNPLFLEQLLSMLIDDELLQRDGVRWIASDDLNEVPVPQSVQLLVAARLDRLSPTELTVLECAAVEGSLFHRAPLRLAAEDCEPGLDVDAALRTLVAKELVRPTVPSDTGDEAYRFLHTLIRDVAYAGMPKQSRGRLHELFAKWIEANAGDRIMELEEVLGHHLEQAYRLRAELGAADNGLARSAAERLEHVGRRAHGRGDFQSAAGLLARADGLNVAAGERRLELLHARGAALRLSGAFADARAVLDEGLVAAVDRGERRLEAHLMLEQCSVRLMADPTVSLSEVESIAEHALWLFTDPDDDRGLAHAYSLLGDVHLFRCRFGKMETVYERALIHARRAGDEQGSARAHGKLAQAAFLGPRAVESGIDRCEQIRLQPDADPSARAHAAAALGVLDAMRGNFDEGRARIGECRALCEEFGLERAAAWVPGYAGCVELVAGDAAAAGAELRRGYVALRSLGETAVLATTAALLAQALERQGRLEEVELLLAESAETIGTGDLVSQIYWSQVRARIRAAHDDAVIAERLAREAVALAAETDMLAVHAATLVDLARIVEGRQREQALTQAVELFEAKGDIVDAARARSALS
jgi:DNA-binding SARP family transcriptional activator